MTNYKIFISGNQKELPKKRKAVKEIPVWQSKIVEFKRVDIPEYPYEAI